jgi:alkanesulfonate monooxygenase SsuD/methylene tetrahydromethanopterin reductase-like flavin-dependent oxidoreductase (luciferase family)
MRIGVAIPISEQAGVGTPSYATIRALARQAEEADFDSIWLFDHLLFRRPGQPTAGIWECWTVLSALAEATSRTQLGTLVTCTAFRNPALLAKMATAVDAISGGRLILGLGAGWHEPEFEAFGIPFSHRVDRFEEALQIIVPLLRTGQVDFQGVYERAPSCELRPAGPRARGPEILIGSSGPRMLRLTARYGDSWNTCWLGQPGALATPYASMLAACQDEGRDPATLAVTVGVNVAYLAAGTPADALPDPDKALFGTVAEVAAGLRGYAARGVAHVICNLTPMNAESLSWFAEVAQSYRHSAGLASTA